MNSIKSLNSLRNFGATNRIIAVEILPIIVALAIEVVVIAVKPEIVEVPNRTPGRKTDFNKPLLIDEPLRRTIR